MRSIDHRKQFYPDYNGPATEMMVYIFTRGFRSSAPTVVGFDSRCLVEFLCYLEKATPNAILMCPLHRGDPRCCLIFGKNKNTPSIETSLYIQAETWRPVIITKVYSRSWVWMTHWSVKGFDRQIEKRITHNQETMMRLFLPREWQLACGCWTDGRMYSSTRHTYPHELVIIEVDLWTPNATLWPT